MIGGRTILTLATALLLEGRPDATVLRPQNGASELELKAAFLHNFARFVEWPEGAFNDAAGEFRLGVLGSEPTADSFERILKDKKVGNRTLKILRGKEPEELSGCALVFVAEAAKEKGAAALTTLNGKPVLCVGESEGFAQAGGILNFYLDAKNVKFELNPDAAARGGFKVTKLIRIAPRLVREK